MVFLFESVKIGVIKIEDVAVIVKALYKHFLVNIE